MANCKLQHHIFFTVLSGRASAKCLLQCQLLAIPGQEPQFAHTARCSAKVDCTLLALRADPVRSNWHRLAESILRSQAGAAGPSAVAAAVAASMAA
eukprot:7355638-Alexandrium_andersonii.AAC.1